MTSKRKILGVAAVAAAVGGVAAMLVGGVASGATTAVPSWCGSKKISLSLSDGFGGNNWRRITRGEAEDEASKCPNVTKFVYTDGQANLQKSISDIQSLAAQSLTRSAAFQAVFKKYPGIHFIGTKPFEVTNWDPALTQKVVTAVLAKYPKIDGFMTDFGAAFASSLAAF